MKQAGIVCVGAGHTHYQGFSEYVIESPFTRLLGVYDPDKGKSAVWAKNMNTKAYDSYDDVLNDPEVDGIIVTSAPGMHEYYIVNAAEHGKHCMTEIPLATSNEAAYRIRDAVKKSGILFVLSNPVKHAPQCFAKRLVDSGLIGEILNMRVRNVHDNSVLYENGRFPEFGYVYNRNNTGGGALNNVGYHGVALLYWFLGRPESAIGMFVPITEAAQKDSIDENTVVVYKFPGKALGIVETGWVHPRFQGGFEIHGTKGSIVIFNGDLYYRLSGDKDWTKVAPKGMPTGEQHSVYYFLEHVCFNEPIVEYGIDDAIELTEMANAAFASQGREVKL